MSNGDYFGSEVGFPDIITDLRGERFWPVSGLPTITKWPGAV
jgi:hypothetical protein